MERKDTSVTGGVLIQHTFQQGEHHYEIEKVVKNKMTHGRISFLSKGDMLLKINDMDLRDLPPELFAELLAESSPRLTVYQPHKNAPKEKCLENGGFRAFSKENKVLSFNLDLSREADPDDVTKENFHEAAKPESQLDKLLLVTMISTSFSVITGRGCDKEGLCQDKFCTECNQNDVIMEAKSSNITQVLGEITFIQEKVQDNIFIQSLMYEKYIQNRQRLARMSSNCMTNSVNITIYLYKTTCIKGEYRGIPVVLNFSGTDCFLKCSKSGDEPTVSIESSQTCVASSPSAARAGTCMRRRRKWRWSDSS
ncbi:uncharacterized protein LOC125710137 isoform X2 [Brienomyrus brachyistius]|uniref:uncharacterized protein LOC125710137 isoform X2 n=1 Tax=Brienomyrus brachyistius TaxID=42636 RepID=UPI0020B2513C|nr:uncharacterized protein LOC125710137 isoform X2 [Brienomyrus brachyistius]